MSNNHVAYLVAQVCYLVAESFKSARDGICLFFSDSGIAQARAQVGNRSCHVLAFHSPLRFTGIDCLASNQPRLSHGGSDERREQRMRSKRLRLQFGMELHADEPGGVRQL